MTSNGSFSENKRLSFEQLKVGGLGEPKFDLFHVLYGFDAYQEEWTGQKSRNGRRHDNIDDDHNVMMLKGSKEGEYKQMAGSSCRTTKNRFYST